MKPETTLHVCPFCGRNRATLLELAHHLNVDCWQFDKAANDANILSEEEDDEANA